MQIIETHLFILDDPDLKEGTVEKIKKDNYSASYAWSLSAKEIIERYGELENDYLKIRHLMLKMQHQEFLNIL